MYGKYTLFYESPKNWGYYVHVQMVCTRSLLGGERGLGTRVGFVLDKDHCVAFPALRIYNHFIVTVHAR